MSLYNANIPQPGDFLSVSQQDILNNFTQLNTSFTVDHYAYDDTTANNGKHNKVTTPLIVGGSHPITIADEPQFYAMQDSANLGVIQYSRGPSEAVPTPLTRLQSPSTPIALTNSGGAPANQTDILDFTGISFAMFTVHAGNLGPNNPRHAYAIGWWRSSIPAFNIQYLYQSNSSFNIEASGNILRIRNSSSSNALNNVYWTLQFERIWT